MSDVKWTWDMLDGKHRIARLTLSRPDSANALTAAMLDDITRCASEIALDATCRAVVLSGEGKHFCGGADLAWMQASAQLSYAANVDEAKRLTRMFEALVNLPMPLVGCVRGSAFGGAVGLAAVCDVVVASETAKFCLSEVRLGLLPAVIMPYLMRRMSPGALRRNALTARVFTASDALAAGLVDRVGKDDELEKFADEELRQIMSGAPSAQAEVKRLMTTLRLQDLTQSDVTAHAIAKARASEEGREGLAAYFRKQKPSWQ